MKVPTDAYPALHDLEPSVDELLLGLSRHPKSIAPKFFYDQIGSQLFDEICCLDEYYLTRTEMRILLDHLRAPAAYVPVDIARAQLLQCSARLASSYPKLRITPVCADFTTAFTLPEIPRGVR